MRALPLALVACGAPISNSPFLEEAEFVGALPTSARYGAPSQVRASPGVAPALEAAKEASERYASIVEIPTIVGDELQALGPSIREENLREWDATKIVVRGVDEELGLPNDELVLFVRAEVERVARDEGTLYLAIDVGPTRGGPWERVADGGWDGDGQGELTWDLARTLDALDIALAEPVGVITSSFDDRGYLDGERAVEVEYTIGTGETSSYAAGGEDLLSFGAPLEVTDDGLAWPGYATVVHRQDAGGYASGAVYRDADEIAFVQCWDASGTVTHTRGDPGVASSGDRASCVEGAP